MPEHTIVYLIIGLASGVLSGTFGVGAGIIMIPAMAHLAIAQKDAQGIALAVMVPMAFMGALHYHLNPAIKVDFRIVGLIVVTALIGVYFGSNIAASLNNTLLRKLFALFLFGVSIKMWMMK